MIKDIKNLTEVDFKKQHSSDSLFQLDQISESKLDIDFSDTDVAVEENEYERPMAMIVEDDYLCQMCVRKELEKMNFLYVAATTVNEAKDIYLLLEKEGISIDVLYLDLLLKDNSTGIEFLKTIRENHWMEKTYIIIMSGVDDFKTVSDCYDYKIENYLLKPITKQNFQIEKMKIMKHLEKNKCPIKGYKIIKDIGSGATAVVYLVRNQKTKKLFAMKEVTIRDNKFFKFNEINFLKHMNSPTVISFQESLIENGKMYMIIEYAEYGTLNTRIAKYKKENKHFEIDEILNWMAEIYLGLYSIHMKGVMHRDIKSENLFICKNDVIKIGDMGIARNETNAQTFCGTLCYMAPEMFNFQSYNFSIDIWAAGVILYELIMLNKPFDGMDVKNKILNSQYDNIPENTDPRLKRLLSLTLVGFERRATSKDLLQLDFIRERINYLFTNGILTDVDDFYSTVCSLPIMKEGKFFPYENSEEEIKYLNEKDEEYLYKMYKILILIYIETAKIHYFEKFYSIESKSVIEESYMKNYIQSVGISTKEFSNLLKFKFILPIQKKEKYYYIRIKLDEKIDNSFSFPDPTNDFDPVELSIDCLKAVYNLILDMDNIILEGEKENNTIKYELMSSKKYYNFEIKIKRLQKINLKKCNKNQKFALILNIYQTMYYHYILKILCYEEQPLYQNVIRNFFKLFSSFKDKITITYNIGGSIISIFQLKNSIIKNNNLFFNGIFNQSNNFLDENWEDMSFEKKLKLETVFIDPPNLNTNKDLFDIEPIITYFRAETLDENLDDSFSKFLQEDMFIDNNLIHLPYFFYSYSNGDKENKLLKILKEHFNQTNLNEKESNILSNFFEGNIQINYYKIPPINLNNK